jgi:hypothetical protein
MICKQNPRCYDIERIANIQEMLQYAIDGMERARKEGDEDIVMACEFLAASYNTKLAQLIGKCNRGKP